MHLERKLRQHKAAQSLPGQVHAFPEAVGAEQHRPFVPPEHTSYLLAGSVGPLRKHQEIIGYITHQVSVRAVEHVV